MLVIVLKLVSLLLTNGYKRMQSQLAGPTSLPINSEWGQTRMMNIFTPESQDAPISIFHNNNQGPLLQQP